MSDAAQARNQAISAVQHCTHYALPKGRSFPRLACVDCIEDGMESLVRDLAERTAALREAVLEFLTEKTIRETIEHLSLDGRDHAFAAEVPQYLEDCESVTKAYDKLRAFLIETEGQR